MAPPNRFRVTVRGAGPRGPITPRALVVAVGVGGVRALRDYVFRSPLADSGNRVALVCVAAKLISHLTHLPLRLLGPRQLFVIEGMFRSSLDPSPFRQSLQEAQTGA